MPLKKVKIGMEVILNKKIIIFYFLITLIFFGTLIKLEYATDSYSVFSFNKEQIYMQYANSGRFITAIIGKILKNLDISEQVVYKFSWGIAIICAIFSQYKLYTIIRKNVKSKIFNVIIPTIIIINPFSIELCLYIEKGIMWFGVLMSIFAVDNLVKWLECNHAKFKYAIYAILFIFFANCSYQGVVGIFLTISLVYVLKYSKNKKQFILNNIWISLIYGIPTIANYLSIRNFFESSRIKGQIIFFESLQKIYFNTIDMIKNMYSLLPKYVFIFLILFTFGLFCCKIVKEKNKISKIMEFFYITIGSIIISIMPQFIQPTSYIWFVPRSTYCFASLYGILILYLLINYEINNIEKFIILSISFVLILVQLQKFIEIEKDRYLLNKQDEQVTKQIIEQIDYYELQTGNEITEISIYQDEKPNYTYNGIFATGDINVKCYANDWSAVAILNYYSKKNLKLAKKDEGLIKHFSTKNWDEFDPNQILFERNKLILCNY